MRIQHFDKSVGPGETKLNAAQAAVYAHNTSKLGLTGDEANEVGRAVALAAEEASFSPGAHALRAKMRQLAEPTQGEAAELNRALATYDSLLEQREKARLRAMEAEHAVHDSIADGGYFDHHDPAAADRTARAQRDLAEAELLLARATTALDVASGDVGRARGAIAQNGAARQRRYVSGRI